MKKSTIWLCLITAMFIVVTVIGIFEIRSIINTANLLKDSEACGGEGLYITDSNTGKTSYVDLTTYVDEKFDVVEKATTSYGVEYSKEGKMNLLDVDCDVKEAFEILDCVRMHVKISNGDMTHYRAYAKGSDGNTYLVETDESGNILRDSEGNAIIIKRCDFADLYLGEE